MRRSSRTSVPRRRPSATVGFWLAVLAWTTASPALGGPADGILLRMTRGPGAEEVTLDWAGGAFPYKVYRSTAARDVVDPANLVVETGSNRYIDRTPRDDLLFYQVTGGLAGDCPPAANLSCGAAVASSNTAPGSSDVFDGWECFTLSNYTGPEIVHRFVSPGSGLVEAVLTDLTADLDLLVIGDVSGACESTDPTVCEGSSTRSGTSDERVEWSAVAGRTYFIVVDGYNGAVGDFTLRVGAAPNHVTLSEVNGGTPDFVELRNRSACDVSLASHAIRHAPECSGMFDWSFTASDVIASGGVFRIVDMPTTAENEVYTGFNVCDNPAASGYTMLCEGVCDAVTCGNVLDYVERTDGAAPGGPVCATFSPAPIDTSSSVVGESTNRISFFGVSPAWFASDWTLAPVSRD